MWFEGESNPRQFIAALANMITAVDNSLPTPAPLWENISSKVGTLVADDGYVFRSLGSSGKDNILINLKNAWNANSENNFHFGPVIGIVDSYTPNAANGQNGTFGSFRLNENLRLAYDASSYNTTILNYRFKYAVSVTKDRIIITIRTNRPGQGTASSDTATIRNVFYAGLIKRYSDEPDTSAVAIATSYPSSANNAYSSIRLLKNAQRLATGTYSAHNANLVDNRRAYGKQMVAVPIPLYAAKEGVRGELDGLLTTYHLAVNGPTRTTPEEAYVLIDGRQYLCLAKPFNDQWSLYCNFSQGITRQALLIEII